MSDIAHFYCEKCPNTLAVHLYSTYATRRIYPGVFCECGGQFFDDMPTRCPHCRDPVPKDVIKKQIHWQATSYGGAVVIGAKCYKGNGETYAEPGVEEHFGSWIG